MPAAVSSTTNLHLLSRYPIFTAAKTVWGYEIQATSSLDSGPQDPERANVGATVIAGDYIGLNTILARNKKMLLSYTRDQLLKQIPYAFPAQSSAILISPDFQNDPDLLPALKQMAADGHTIALEWNAAITPLAALMEMASVICLGSPDMAEELAKIPLAAKTLIVRNVTTREELERLQSLGISLFQGRFFKTAEIIPGKKLSSHQNSRLQILRIIEAESPNLDKLAQTIQADVSLSYRLLTYLNSPTFGFMRKIDSIRQAITLLGWINVRNWLRAVLLADITQGDEQVELLHLSLWRGKFLEQTVAGHDYWDFKPDEMFLLGMFSLLDAILGIPMADALAFLPLNDAQKKALRGENTTEYMPLLTLMLAFEDQDADTPGAILQDLNLDQETMQRLHREAGAWASSILEIGQGA